MAVWKTREGKNPPGNWYAQVIGHLVQSYPAAQLDAAELTAQLQPIWNEQWRNGKNAQTVAATTCSCDGGRTIQPSPGVKISLPRGSVRGPTKLPRGVIPDPAALRESLDLEKLKRAAVASATRASRSLELLRAHAKRAKPKTEEGLVVAQRKHQEIRASLAAEMVVLQSLRDQISEERSKRELAFVNALPALPSAPAKTAADDLDIVLGIKAPKAPKAPKAEKPVKTEEPAKTSTAVKPAKPAKAEKPAKPAKAGKKPTQAEKDARTLALFTQGMAAALSDIKDKK